MKITTSITFILWTTLSFAQNKYTISGTVSDAATGETIIGTTVTVKERPGTGVACNNYGYYALSLQEGNYTLIINFLGYERIESFIELKSDLKKDYKLSPDSKILSEVEVTATKKNDNIISTEIGVEKLEVKEIKKIPVLFGEQDILKTLQLLPGVKSAGEGSGGLYVRGGDNSQNLILLDEATVYNASHLLGFFQLSTVMQLKM